MNIISKVTFQGYPGCGKTYVMGIVRRALEREGFSVHAVLYGYDAGREYPHEMIVTKRVRRDKNGRVVQ